MEKVNDYKTFVESLDNVLMTNINVGIHGVRYVTQDDLMHKISSIMDKGLNINESLLSNIELCGTTSDLNYRKLYNYAYQNDGDYVVNVIVMLPITIENSNKEEYYIGNLQDFDRRNIQNMEYQKYNEQLNSFWINTYCTSIGHIPREFVVGVTLYDRKKDKTNFVVNPNYIGLKSDEDRHLFYDKFLIDVQNVLSNVNLLGINSNNIDDIYNQLLIIIESYKRFNKNTYYFEQLKEYIKNNYHLSKKK